MTPERRQRLVAAARVAIAFALLWYLAASGIIDWTTLGGMARRWPLTLVALATLLIGMVMASWRLCLLTDVRGLRVSLGNSMRLTLIGNAANLFLPAIGSDVARVYIAARGQSGRRTEIATIILLDRVLGLIGILLLPLVLAPFWAGFVRVTPIVGTLLALSALVAFGLLAAVLVALSRRGIASAPVQFALRLFPLRGYPRRILDTVHGYREHWGAIVRALAWTVAANFLAAVTIVTLQLAMHPGAPQPLGGFLASLAFVANSVPITPGGIGVTEAAFDSLFHLAGIPGGAEAMLGVRVLFLLLAPVGIALYVRGVRRFITVGTAEPAQVTVGMTREAASLAAPAAPPPR